MQIINKNPANKRLRGIFATRWQQPQENNLENNN